jgi:hypothetical protein
MKAWIGVDLDGTLAYYDEKSDPRHIGAPVKPMLDKVKKWIKKGITVKIFTARASVPDHIPFVREWLKRNGLPKLEITNQKDYGMIALYDDRCVQIITNTGELAINSRAMHRSTTDAYH